MTDPLFLADPADIAAARAGSVITVSGDEGRHAATVRRLRAGRHAAVSVQREEGLHIPLPDLRGNRLFARI